MRGLTTKKSITCPVRLFCLNARYILDHYGWTYGSTYLLMAISLSRHIKNK